MVGLLEKFTKVAAVNEIANWKRRILTDVLAPAEKLKLDESALKLEVEAEGLNYSKLKKAVQAEEKLRSTQLRQDCETILEYLDA